MFVVICQLVNLRNMEETNYFLHKKEIIKNYLSTFYYITFAKLCQVDKLCKICYNKCVIYLKIRDNALGKGGSKMRHFVKMTDGIVDKKEIAKFISYWSDESRDLVKEEELLEVQQVASNITSKVYAVVVQNQINVVVAKDGGLDLYKL